MRPEDNSASIATVAACQTRVGASPLNPPAGARAEPLRKAISYQLYFRSKLSDACPPFLAPRASEIRHEARH